MPEPRKHPLTGCRYDTILDYWMIVPERLDDFVNLGWGIVEKGELATFSAQSQEMDAERQEKSYECRHGIACMNISGPMTKMSTSLMSLFGGTSTFEFRKALIKAVADDSVKSIFIEMDSPGGTVSGTQELAHAIRKANQIKPVFVHATDQMTSAAQWVGVMGTRVTCGPTARNGSVGVIVQLVDSSERDKQIYGKPIIISTGKYKATYTPPFTPEKIEEIKREQQKVLDVFWGELVAARPAAIKNREEILTARVFVGQDALRVGLVDAICSTDEAFDKAKELTNKPAPTSRGNAAPRKAHTMLTASEIQSLKGLPGAAAATEENADHVAFTVATQLNADLSKERTAHSATVAKVTTLETELNAAKAKAAPAPMEPTLLRDRCETAVERLHLKMEKGKINTAQFNQTAAALLISGTVDKDGKLSADAKPDQAMFEKDAGGKYRYEKVFAAFDENSPNGLLKDVSGHQPAPRSEPGANGDKKGPPSLARVNELRSKYNEAPLTQAQYDAMYAAELSEAKA